MFESDETLTVVTNQPRSVLETYDNVPTTTERDSQSFDHLESSATFEIYNSTSPSKFDSNPSEPRPDFNQSEISTDFDQSRIATHLNQSEISTEFNQSRIATHLNQSEISTTEFNQSVPSDYMVSSSYTASTPAKQYDDSYPEQSFSEPIQTDETSMYIPASGETSDYRSSVTEASESTAPTQPTPKEPGMQKQVRVDGIGLVQYER